MHVRVCAGEVRMAQGGSQVAARDQGWRGERENSEKDVQGNKKDKKKPTSNNLLAASNQLIAANKDIYISNKQ